MRTVWGSPSYGTFRRLMPFMRPHAYLVILPLVIEIFFCAVTAATPFLVKVAFDEFIPVKQMPGVWIAASLLVLIFASRAVMSAIQRTYLWTASSRTVNGLRKQKHWHWDNTSVTNREWLALNMMTEGRAGFQAFNEGPKGNREVDFIRLRQLLAQGHPWNDELLRAVSPQYADAE